MALAPVDFTMSYLCRPGRVASDRIAESSPRFMAGAPVGTQDTRPVV